MMLYNARNKSFPSFKVCIYFLSGGWLLMEPWITPTIFEEVNVGEMTNKIVDEYTYAQYVDRDLAKERLDRSKMFLLFHFHSIKPNLDLISVNDV